MKVLVTGASGKIGRRLVQKLVQNGSQVIGLTRDEAGAQRVRAEGGEPALGNLADTKILGDAVEGASVVYHLAGGVRGAGSETPDVLNREGTERLRDAIVERGSKPVVVFASSGAVYGDRSGLWVDEGMPPFPNTAYGTSKAAAERLLLDDPKMDTRIARLGIVYGPDFPILLEARRQRGRAFLPGEGRNYLPMIHVDDAVQALLVLAEKGQDNGIYNVADRDPRLFKEFFDALKTHTGGEAVRFWSTWIPSVLQQAWANENERIQARLGRRPVFTPDNLRLYTASLRMRVDRLEKEIGFAWRYPDISAGVASLGRDN
jgi:UDP-glucose 4-epimerase